MKIRESKKLKISQGLKKRYLRNTTPEIEVRCIFDEEDERVLLCQILVPLVPKIYKETDTRCYWSKGRGRTKRMKREKKEGGERREYGGCGQGIGG